MPDVVGLVLLQPAPSPARSRRRRRCGPCGTALIQPPTCRSTYPSPLPSSASPAAAGSTECRSTRTSIALPHRSLTSSLGAGRAPAGGRGAGSCRRPSPSRRTPSRSPTRPSQRPTIVGHAREDRRQRGLDAVLAAHVVRALGLRPARRAAQDQVALGVAQQVGQVGGAAGELARPRGCRRGRRANAARRAPAATRRPPPTSKASSSRTGPRGIAGVVRRAGWHRSVHLVQLGRLLPHHGVVRRAVVQLQRRTRPRAGSSGMISSSPRSSPSSTSAAMSSAVSGELSTRLRDHRADASRRAPRIDRPSGWSGSTTGRPPARCTPYAASSWPAVSVSATTAAFTALYDAIPAGCTSPASEAVLTIVPRALRLEHRHERAGAADHAEQVDLGDPPPLVDRRDVDPAAAGDPGVVDQDVEPAPVLARPSASAAAQSSSLVTSSAELLGAVEADGRRSAAASSITPRRRAQERARPAPRPARRRPR